MIKTLSPCSNTAKTAEIMSRYRPIAPRPEGSASSKIRESPYLRTLWPQMQARPTRTRKRGRAVVSPPNIKRPRTHLLGLSSPSHVTSPAKHLSLQGFVHGIPQLPVPNLVGVHSGLENSPTTATVVANQATVPELGCLEPNRDKVIDLNTVAEFPEEKDLLQQLQVPPTNNVIAPQPVRLVGSSISIACISEDPSFIPLVRVPKKPAEVEEEVESEVLPTVISDSNNKVRLANSAYKEMVGQPECSWLDSMMTGDGSFAGKSCKRICGEVELHLSDLRVPASSNGFSCWVRIEWCNKGTKNVIITFCDVIRLSCASKDYLFSWRFHTRGRKDFQSKTNA
ncbi:hypothetical protein NC651_006036 [Populus alba x Populus x berolinensis]|nr:hypothetical protein NC651_006036 [Populus alba x Populus x berolinensis]